MTKRMIAALCLLLASAARADTEVVTLTDGEADGSHRGGRVALIHVLSSVASGTAALKSESRLWGVKDEVTDLSTSNFTWRVVWSNGTEVATNVTSTAPYPLPRALISATSNWVVTARAATNRVPYVALCRTNALSGTLTCSSGVATNAPAASFVAPGDRIFFTGTAKGRVTVILTR